MTSTRRFSALLATCIGLVALSSPATRALEVPYLSGRVVDAADLLSPDAESALDSKLAALESETGSQVAVLTVPSLEGEVLEDFTLRVAETWKLGRGDFDDGALLFIARDDRKMRLEVGYGLEPIIPDAIARRILDSVIQPRFREGDFDGGVIAAVEAIDGLVKSDGTLPLPEPPARSHSRPRGPTLGFGFIIFLLVVGLFSLQALSAKGCAAWGLYLFLIPFWITFPLAFFGRPGGLIPGVLWILGFPLLWLMLHKTGTGKDWIDRHDGGAGPFIFGGGGGGWSSSGGGFGGGFSGGGGSFGGGGASGSW